MSKTALRIAGYVAFANACCAIPAGLAVLYYSVGKISLITKFELSFLTAIFTAITIYLILSLKKYLQVTFNFHDINQSAVLIIVVSIAYAANDIVATFNTGTINLINDINVGLITLLGLANIYFAFRLYGLQFDLFKMKKSYCFLTLATGILLASVFLSALSIVPGVFSDLMLGTILLMASKETKVVGKIS
jgi:hypothetical protein